VWLYFYVHIKFVKQNFELKLLELWYNTKNMLIFRLINNFFLLLIFGLYFDQIINIKFNFFDNNKSDPLLQFFNFFFQINYNTCIQFIIYLKIVISFCFFISLLFYIKKSYIYFQWYKKTFILQFKETIQKLNILIKNWQKEDQNIFTEHDLQIIQNDPSFFWRYCTWENGRIICGYIISGTIAGNGLYFGLYPNRRTPIEVYSTWAIRKVYSTSRLNYTTWSVLYDENQKLAKDSLNEDLTINEEKLKQNILKHYEINPNSTAASWAKWALQNKKK
jgi:hypothetical protein